MVVEPYWINAQLAIVPRPRGGDWLDDEMLALQKAGIDIVISMLEEPEASELGLGREGVAAAQAGLGFIGYPIPDRGVPKLPPFNDFLVGLENNLVQGKRIGVHCRGCIGRASVVAASLLIRSGIPAEEAWNQIETARGCPVPDTLEQLEWVGRNMRPKPQ
jgi:protein-tyrosine phosphatase